MDGQLIFVGTASFDEGLKWGITHRIDPNIDAERERLVADPSHAISASPQRIDVVPPTLGQNLADDPFLTDGQAVVLRITPGKPAAGSDANGTVTMP